MTPIQALFAAQIRALYKDRYSRELTLGDADIVNEAVFYGVHSLHEAESVIVAFLKALTIAQAMRDEVIRYHQDDSGE